MAWFEINGNHIVSHNYAPWGEYNGAIWGLYIGGRYCLDYTWKLMFGIPDADWAEKSANIRTDKDFYDFCDWLGVWYKKDGTIYRRGEKYNEYGEPVE